MPGAPRDLPSLAHILNDWLSAQERMPARVTRIRAPSGGSSSETYLVDVTIGGQPRRWVLQIEATDFQVYQDAAIERQFRVMAAIGRSGAGPVPQVHWYEPDPAILGSPFFVMDRADGLAPPNDYHMQGVLADATPAAREAMWRDAVQRLAALHRLDPAPFDFLGRPDLGATGFAQEIARWDFYREWTALPPVPMLDRGRQWLEDHRPPPTPPGLSWGDARLSNFLFDRARVTAVLDWETAALGGGESDLGWWLYYDHIVAEGSGIPRLDGIGGRDATIALWEDAVGRKAQAIDWHEAFATWRFACISERAIALAITAGAALSIGSGDANPAVRRMTELIG